MIAVSRAPDEASMNTVSHTVNTQSPSGLLAIIPLDPLAHTLRCSREDYCTLVHGGTKLLIGGVEACRENGTFSALLGVF